MEPKIEPCPETLAEEAEAKYLLARIEDAKEHGLQIEFLMFVIRALKKGETMHEAVWYATCEWDL